MNSRLFHTSSLHKQYESVSKSNFAPDKFRVHFDTTCR